MLIYDQLLEENTQLRTLVAEQAALIAELRQRVSKLEALVEQQAAVIQQQAVVIEQQAAEIEQLKRRGKRQAAPFPKDYRKRSRRVQAESKAKTTASKPNGRCPTMSTERWKWAARSTVRTVWQQCS